MFRTMTIPVIDIFAGPGGLGEGFSAFESDDSPKPFHVKLSIEKDVSAFETLKLRSFYRQFPRGEAPKIYYDVLRQRIPAAALPGHLKGSQTLFNCWKAAEEEALHAELGSSEPTHEMIGRRIVQALGDTRSPWVLIGGPPCQAYSVVGRARNRGNRGYRIEKDQRSSLYREYLRIIADHWPAVFVMENVKGMLSATVQNANIFDQIIEDLKSPLAAFGHEKRIKPSQRYRIVPLVRRGASLLNDTYNPTDFIVPCERFGIPQMRHRVILVGIREDLGDIGLPALEPANAGIHCQIVI
jgi:DNA (cytosine-5)-methyltransferase 1